MKKFTTDAENYLSMMRLGAWLYKQHDLNMSSLAYHFASQISYQFSWGRQRDAWYWRANPTRVERWKRRYHAAEFMCLRATMMDADKCVKEEFEQDMLALQGIS